MRRRTHRALHGSRCGFWLSCLIHVVLSIHAGAGAAAAQPVETVGVRALGMAGAFVAIADDNSATWWNPAGLAAGPFLDLGLARTASGADGKLPAARHGTWSFALSTPPFGLSYYRYRTTGASASPTGGSPAGREEEREGVGVRSLSVSQFGATVLHTLLTGVHVGSTVKYVRGRAHTAAIADPDASLLSISELLDAGDDLRGGDSRRTVDLDVGVLAVAGGIRVGAVVRNLREPEFDGLRLPRQVRMGAAYDGDAAGTIPVIVTLDADLRRYDGGSGERRMMAVGGEHWIVRRRFAVRGGARVDTVGEASPTVTAGASVSPRPAMFVDGYVAGGGSNGEGGWGVAARISF